MAIETLRDIASELADRYGIYNAPTRCEWEADLVERMREAARLDLVIEAGEAALDRRNRGQPSAGGRQ